ncbi:MAG: DUF2220 family protein [Candidatus Endonucleobacter bathymodioli]|uniref:DUF2220 family protein n=1 Tax=Candidatus Endonucleibacter bathymodioli TaxID=539814 RepID=A0AA90SSC2_9GAMM|nr:DUF2220 family protein [Candidatus Endonucleobacter bathymodioli]
MNRLRTLFHEIDNKKPCNWPKLRKLLIKRDVTPATLDQLFHASRAAGDRYLVEVLNPAHYQTLGDRLGIWADFSNRASAAIHGKSHAVPVSGNLVVVKNASNPHPVVFECDSEGHWTYPTLTGTELVLVENLENFLARDGLIAYLRDACGVVADMENTDIAYAAGNAITKACNNTWLASYETVYCFFDIDAGGFRMFEALRRLMEGQSVDIQFVTPKDLGALLDATHRQLTEDEREKLAKYQHCDPPINLLANTLINAGKSLEQEVYLNDK